MKNIFIITLSFICVNVFSQSYLYVPSGTGGIYSSSTNKVGIGISNPGANLEVYNALYPSLSLKGPNSSIEMGVATGDRQFATYAQNADVVY